jgi:hypothetical protein
MSVTARVIQGGWKSKRFPGNEIFAANCRKLAGAFEGARYRARKAPVEALFAAVEERSRILEQIPNSQGIVAFLLRVAMLADRFVRPPEAWTPIESNTRAQLGDLMQHLFARYRTPRFFEHTWWPRRRRQHDWVGFSWFVHVGAGHSIRTAPHLPTTITRAAAHNMMHAPAKLTPLQALRFGQVRAVGAPTSIATAVLRTQAAEDFANDAMWLLLFRKMGECPELEPHGVGPLVDYVRHASQQEDFRLNGRTIPSLTRAMERWHAELRDARRFTEASRFASWPRLEGVEPMEVEREEGTWRIEELCSGRALFEEGRRMHHCVLMYAGMCMSRMTSIWSLQGPDERSTIRIDLHTKKIVEARTFANEPISREAHRFLSVWAAQNDLELGPVTAR